jgi:hypothetical protein
VKTRERVGCIYLLRNLVNGKGYVGQYKDAENVERRWNRHISTALNTADTRPLYRAIRRAWRESKGCTLGFSAEVLWRGAGAKLNAMEVKYVKKLNTFIDDGCGYNLTRGGDQPAWSRLGRKNISAGLRRYHKKNPDAVILMAERSTKVLSKPDVRAKMSIAGKKLWAEGTAYHKKIVKAFRKRWDDPVKKAAAVAAMQEPKTRAIVNEAVKSYWAKPESKASMAAIAKIWWEDPTYRYRQEHPSEETFSKLSVAAQRRWAKPNARKKHGAAIRRAWVTKREREAALNAKQQS